MKKISQIAALVILNLVATPLFAQTNGTLTFTFTEVFKSSSSTYGNTGKHVLAVWIESNLGTFIKTKIRYAGGGTSDHLPTWAVKSGGSSFNCLSSSCNVVSATTGATRSSFGTRTITWDGTDVSGNVVPDGTYRVIIQETWSHSGSGTAYRSFMFTKGPNTDSQTPVDDANFSSISLEWAATAGIDENTVSSNVVVYPNPSADGIFTIDYTNATEIKVFNVKGVVILSEKLKELEGTKSIDLSNFAGGSYIIQVLNGDSIENFKVTSKQ